MSEPVQYLYKVSKLVTGTKKKIYMNGPRTWTKKGRLFSVDELLKILRIYFNEQSGTERFPDHWEIQEFQFSFTKFLKVENFIKQKAKSPFIKGI